MSSKGSPWQSGKQESFYQKFKFEMEEPNNYQSQGELIEAIASKSITTTTDESTALWKMPPTVFTRDLKRQKNQKISLFWCS